VTNSGTAVLAEGFLQIIVGIEIPTCWINTAFLTLRIPLCAELLELALLAREAVDTTLMLTMTTEVTLGSLEIFAERILQITVGLEIPLCRVLLTLLGLGIETITISLSFREAVCTLLVFPM